MKRVLLALLGCAHLATAPHAAASEPLDVLACVREALKGSAQVKEAEAKVQEYQARLAEVQSVYYPKLQALTWVAPNFTVQGDATQYRRSFDKLGDWGPWAHLQAVLAQPLYTFGRAEAGERAASERLAVERARLRATEHVVAMEVHKFYYLHLYARSMQPALKQGAELLDEALEKGQEEYDKASGEVTGVDLAKLRFGKFEVQKYRLIAEQGAELALAALKHTMGLGNEAELQLADKRLATPEGAPLGELVTYLAHALEHRPEVAQIKHGLAATDSWEEAERKANWPVLFLAGQLLADWTPTRDDAINPYVYDPYNQLIGGFALGLQFSVDPWLASAKGDIAAATREQVRALKQLADTGIPLQVRKAYVEAHQAEELVRLSDESVSAAKQWMVLAASNYLTGTGEAKDVLEGLVAYLQGKQGYYDNLQKVYLARAELDQATGARPWEATTAKKD